MGRSRSREGDYRSRRQFPERGGGGDRFRDTRSDRRDYRPRRPGRNKSEDRFGRSLRDISNSRERSRERERRRRKMQADCIRRAGGYQMLADIEGKDPVRLFWDGFQWVAKTGHSTALQNDPALMNSTRKMRRLYFGNLPLHLGLTETNFQEIVWEEMKRRSFCNDENENPVLCVWFAKDKGNYGFVEFASVEETERALTMDGMVCLGVPLKVSRPNDYTTTSAQQNQAMALMGKQSAQMLQMQLQSIGAPPPPPPPVVAPVELPGPPTRLIRVIQIVLASGVEAEADYWDILDDVREGFEPYGKITRAQIVTPRTKGDSPFDVGDVVLEFCDAAAADNCVRNMIGRKYEGRAIQMVKLHEDEMGIACEKIFSENSTR